MPAIKLTGDPWDISRVIAVMLFPSDEPTQRQYFATQLARYHVLEAQDTDPIRLDAYTLRLLLEAPSYETQKEIATERTKRAVVAGDLLASMYVMDRFKLPEPSMNKAIFVASQYAKKARYGDGKQMNVSERMIRDCWAEYMPVAHLWAAFRINEAYPVAAGKDIWTLEGFTPFLQVAAGLFDFGIHFVPVRAKEMNRPGF